MPTRSALAFALRHVPILMVLSFVSSCGNGDTVLLKVTADGPVDKFKLYIRNNVPDANGKRQFVFTTPDWTDATKMGTVMINDGEHGIGVKLPGPGDYSIVLLGMTGRVPCLDPQHDDLAMPVGDGGLMEEYGSGVAYFWAATGLYMGNEELPARMFEVKHAPGMNEDQDCDSFPDVNTWPVRLGGQVTAIPTTLLDCNDQKQAINPFASEQCGALEDQDCDGHLPPSMCADADGDGDPDDSDCASMDKTIHHPNAMDRYPELANCCGYSFNEADARAGRMPSHDAKKSYAGTAECPMVETCSKKDFDCDGNVTSCLRDQDCDRFYAAAQMDAMCKAPPNAPAGNDCNDCDPAVSPGATEICGDGKDNNCDGKIDEGCVSCDLDGDGYQRKDTVCPEPAYMGAIDCNDDDRAVYNGAMAVKVPLEAVGANNVCDPAKATNSLPCALRNFCGHNKGAVGDVDCAMAIATAGCPPATAMVNGKAEKCDADGDGFINEAFKVQCDPMGKVPNYDCNDNDPWTFPGAPDKCGDAKAQNCDQDVPCASIADADKDGYEDKWDCDKANPDIHPGAIDICDGKDDDCDGLIDEDNPDPAGNPMGTLASAKQCNNSGIGECKPQPGGKSGHCVCSAFSIKDYYFTNDNSRVLCPGDASDPAKNDKEGSSAPRCYLAQQPLPKETCDGKDTSCTGFADILPADHKTVQTTMTPWKNTTYTLTDCPGPLAGQVCCPPPMGGGPPLCKNPKDGDPANCGNCNIVCSSANIKKTSCGNSLCNGDCTDGFADCNTDKLKDGCENNVANNPDNCGIGGSTGMMGANGLPGIGCGVACSGNHIPGRSCSMGVCNGTCAANFADCNMNKLMDGCELQVDNNVDNCGAGGNTGPTEPNGQGVQGAGCGVACSSANIELDNMMKAKRSCVAGVCNGLCAANFADCDGNKQTNGCELRVDNNADNCGLGGNTGPNEPNGQGIQGAGCGIKCPAVGAQNLATRTCVTGLCSGNCSNNFADCDANKLNNGCETRVDNDPNNCGAGGATGVAGANGLPGAGCKVSCPMVGSVNLASRSCGAGLCNGNCAANFADCDVDKLVNGCETRTDNNPDHCGLGGVAGKMNANGFQGAGCGVSCPMVGMSNMATRSCGTGLCNGNCAANFADCNANKLLDGCETNAANDPNNCGVGGATGVAAANGLPGAGCGVSCPMVGAQNMATRSCGAGLCSGNCAANFADCDNNKLANGCEDNVANDPNNCGIGGATGAMRPNGLQGAGCGVACPAVNALNMATRTCGVGLCNGSCNGGFADCNVNKLSDGCEINVANDPNNCGVGGATGANMANGLQGAGCGVTCPAIGAQNMATRSCGGGLCNGNCAAGFGDCNINKLGDGCETNVAADPNNCGVGGATGSNLVNGLQGAGCGVSCSSNHIAMRTCGAGVCNGACAVGFADCNGNKLSDGCELNSAIDPNNCGVGGASGPMEGQGQGQQGAGCGVVCSSTNMATRTCGTGVCNGNCANTFADCDGNKQSTGCEKRVDNDPDNCGVGGATGVAGANGLPGAGCGVACSNSNMQTRTCGAGLCNGNCTATFADCDGNKLANGCETRVDNNPDNCGAGGATGVAGANGLPGLGCGLSCPMVGAMNMATRSCGAGLCNGSCANNFADCDANKLTNGCERRVDNDPLNCGVGGATGMAGANGLPGAGCGVACSTGNIGVRTCAAGICNGNCNAGFADCNGNKLSDGCEERVDNDADNCGLGGATGPMEMGGQGLQGAGCGVVCNNTNMLTRTCAAGVCNGSCGNNFADCNGNKQTDGCEKRVDNDPDNCGVGGAGGPVEGGGQGNQGAGCLVVCSNTNMAARICTAGICNGNCNAGFADCNANKQTNGCETRVDNDPNNCGVGGATGAPGVSGLPGAGCGISCSSSNVALRTCGAGICNGTCSANFADCDGNKLSNGCEKRVDNDPDNCGLGGATGPMEGGGQGQQGAGCSVVCNNSNMATRTCGAGVCNGACSNNFADCNGNKQTDGCEKRVDNDVDNCGVGGNTGPVEGGGQGNQGAGCGIACSAANIAARSCVSGVCNGNCNANFADCNGNKQTDGCEKRVDNDPDNCGLGGATGPIEGGGQGQQGAGCGITCSNNHMQTRTCGAGVCNGTCAAGFADCDGNKQSNGCETDTNNDVNNCGGCGIVCGARGDTCVAGVCTCNGGAGCNLAQSAAGGQRCVVGVGCVCDGMSCGTGCCSGNNCQVGTADGACGGGGVACANCAGNLNGSICTAQHCGCTVKADCPGVPAPRSCQAGFQVCVTGCVPGVQDCNGGCCDASGGIGNEVCVDGREIDNKCGNTGIACVTCPGGAPNCNVGVCSP